MAALKAHQRRSPGEIAFDICFIPVAILFVLGVVSPLIVQQLSAVPGRGLPREAVVGLSMLAAVYWFWAAKSVLVSWKDPFAKVLRFSSAGLLLVLLGYVVGLWAYAMR